MTVLGTVFLCYHFNMKSLPETVLAYIQKDDSFLMLYRNKKKNDINANKWIGVGGHIKKGETKEDALYREIKEETGLEVKEFEYKGLIHFNYGELSEIMHLFIVTKVSGELTDCDEGILKYIPKNEILNLPIWEGDRIFLEKLLSNAPYFELELNYQKDALVSYKFIK